MLGMFLLFLLKEPQTAIKCARFGLLLWAKQLLPSLLPFLILTQILIRSSYLDRICERLHLPQSYFVLFAGTLCGFPMGCKLAMDLYAYGQLSKEDASLLSVVANQMSPAFVGGYILSETLRLPQLIPLTYAILYAPALACGVCILAWRHRRRRFAPGMISAAVRSCPEGFLCYGKFIEISYDTKKSTSELQMNVAILDAGIMNSFETMLKLGGYVMLFAVLTGMCRHYLAALPILSTAVAGLLEITGAVSVLNQTLPDTYLKYVAILSATAFGGCSGIAQTASLIHTGRLPDGGLSIGGYIRGRLLLAGITALLAALLYPAAVTKAL